VETPIKSLDYCYTFAFDCDGVLTPSTIQVGDAGNNKHFSIYDGTGFHLLSKMGFRCIVISTDRYSCCSTRAKQLNVEYIRCPVGASKNNLLADHGIVSYFYIGDDIGDVSAISASIFSFCPKSAPSYIKSRVDIVLQTAGGSGVVLEVALLVADQLSFDVSSIFT